MLLPISIRLQWINLWFWFKKIKTASENEYQENIATLKNCSVRTSYVELFTFWHIATLKNWSVSSSYVEFSYFGMLRLWKSDRLAAVMLNFHILVYIGTLKTKSVRSCYVQFSYFGILWLWKINRSEAIMLNFHILVYCNSEKLIGQKQLCWTFIFWYIATLKIDRSEAVMLNCVWMLIGNTGIVYSFMGQYDVCPIKLHVKSN